MRPGVSGGSQPALLKQATELAEYVAAQDIPTLAKVMGVSDTLAAATHTSFQQWKSSGGSPAIDTFIGDIYSGLQAAAFTPENRDYADQTLRILSGLYGVLKPLDAVQPYRLEMAYKFPDTPYNNLYTFWGDTIAKTLPPSRIVINTSSVEYTKAIFPYLGSARIITPRFLTISPKTGAPTFVTVHAKIARGAFARWLIVNRIEDESRLRTFTDLGYVYDPSLSTGLEPVYIAQQFHGLGLSVRLT